MLACALFVALGQWQLSRAAAKESLAAAIENQRHLTPLTGDDLTQSNASATFLYRPVRLQGHWAREHTVFLDNRQMNAKPGFFALTPLLLDGAAGVVLVQRGWVQRHFNNRADLPGLDTPTGLVEVQGRVVPWPSKLFELGGPESGVIRQNLDFDLFRAQSKLALLPLSVQQTGELQDGLLRQWQPANFGTAKHYGYAFQWFALAALVMALFLWFQIVKPRRSKSST